MEATINQIAKQTLGIRTLETRKSDSLDFHELAVWSLKEALNLAYQAGKADIKDASAKKHKPVIEVAKLKTIDQDNDGLQLRVTMGDLEGSDTHILLSYIQYNRRTNTAHHNDDVIEAKLKSIYGLDIDDIINDIESRKIKIN